MSTIAGAPSTSKFRHRPFESPRTQIRLIRIYTNASNEQVSCEQRHFDIGDAAVPEYIALSYTWGSPAPTTTVQINDQSFIVRRNLWDFLKEAYRRQSRSWMWIDQMCIDQTNVIERNEQVSIMADIYGNAQKVVTWLGDPPSQDPIRLFLWLDDHELHISKAFSPLQVACMHQSVIAFCQNSYWTRLWIIQEMKLAPDLEIWWGTITLNDTRLKNLIARSKTDTVPWSRNQNWGHIGWLVGYMSAKESLVRREHEMRMLELPENIFSSECAELCDKIYGLQSILRPSSRVVIDYRKGVAPAFRDVLRVLFKELYPVFDLTELQMALDRATYLRSCFKFESIDDDRIFARLAHQVHTEIRHFRNAVTEMEGAGGDGDRAERSANQNANVDMQAHGERQKLELDDAERLLAQCQRQFVSQPGRYPLQPELQSADDTSGDKLNLNYWHDSIKEQHWNMMSRYYYALAYILGQCQESRMIFINRGLVPPLLLPPIGNTKCVCHEAASTVNAEYLLDLRDHLKAKMHSNEDQMFAFLETSSIGCQGFADKYIDLYMAPYLRALQSVAWQIIDDEIALPKEGGNPLQFQQQRWFQLLSTKMSVVRHMVKNCRDETKRCDAYMSRAW